MASPWVNAADEFGAGLSCNRSQAVLLASRRRCGAASPGQLQTPVQAWARLGAGAQDRLFVFYRLAERKIIAYHAARPQRLVDRSRR
jgi:hypothetical protein